MNRLLYFAFGLCLTVSILMGQEGAKRSEFRKGFHSGSMESKEGSLTFFTFSDTFADDTRNKYSIDIHRESQLNELGFFPLSSRGGVFYSEKKKALYVEAGYGTTTEIKKTFQPLTEFAFQAVIKPVAVFPPNGKTEIVLYNNKNPFIAFKIDGNIHTKPSAQILSNKNATVTASEAFGYAGIAGMGPKEEGIDRYPIYNPKPFTIMIIKTGNRYMLLLDGKVFLSVKNSDPVKITALGIRFSNQEGTVDSLRITSLKGSYTSKVIETDKKSNRVIMDIIHEDNEFRGFSLSVSIKSSNIFKELLIPVLKPPVTLLSEFPCEITNVYQKRKFIVYRIDFALNPAQLIEKFDSPLPLIKYISFQKD